MPKTLKLAVFLALIFLSASCQSKKLNIHFLDVGEGDSILIEAPNGQAVLVDAGGLLGGPKVVNYLEARKINFIEHLIFTHPDPDHIGGIFFIMPACKIAYVYDNGKDLKSLSRSQDIYRWYQDLARENEHYSVLRANEIISLGQVTLEVIWPPQEADLADFNTNSLVIMVKYKSFRCLLGADLTEAGEKQLLERGTDLGAYILKVGHHGAEDASSKEFLKAVGAKTAIISVDAKNIWGYPSQVSLERLERSGAKIYRTDKQGCIVATVDKTGRVSLASEKK